MVRKIVYLLMIICLNMPVFATISGQVNHNDMNYKNRIIDKTTKKPLSNAKISIPELNYTTYSDKDGSFRLNADISSQTVLFVEKEGYKVFSLAVDNSVLNGPLKLGIEQSTPFDIQISEGVIHLGDNMYSNNSANSTDFRTSAVSSTYKKTFKKPSFSQNQDVIIRIGTIIGLDTKKAKEHGQNRIAKVYSSPMEVFVNSRRIATIELNGENIEIVVPKNILKETNELKIITGKNLFQLEYDDYDDMEMANIRIETKERSIFARH